MSLPTIESIKEPGAIFHTSDLREWFVDSRHQETSKLWQVGDEIFANELPDDGMRSWELTNLTRHKERVVATLHSAPKG